MAIVGLYLKHDDRVALTLDNVSMHSDYLPNVNAVLGGDDTQLEIDNETGRIIGWTPIQIKDGEFVTEDD